jgi:hypothetical protein
MQRHPTRRTATKGLLALAASPLLPGANAVAAKPARGERVGEAYLLSYFTDADEGRAGLKLAASDDGYVFTPLGDGRGFLVPTVGPDRLMRDPCIAQGPDGLWHLVWTSGWFNSTIGHATSPDLVRWSPQQAIPVMESFHGVRNTWAPEIIWDARARHWVIMWSSSVAGRFGATAGNGFEGLNSRPYFTTTRDFRTFTPTRLLFDPGFDSIDFTWVDLGHGRLQLVYKDETHGTGETRRWLVSSTAASPTGPFGPPSPHFTGTMTEGPTVVRMKGGFLVYYDVYEQKHFGGAFTTDFRNWTDVTGKVRFPAGARHGTVRRVDPKVIRTIQATG